MHKQGEALTFAVFGLAFFAMLGFFALSFVRPNDFRLTNILQKATTTVATSTSTHKSDTTVTNKIVTLDLCGGRCTANEFCREDQGCEPCYPDPSGNYTNTCTCQKVYNCVSR